MNNSKEFELVKLKDEKDNNINKFSFTDNRFIFYCGLFYCLGLFIGSYFYKLAQSDKLNNIVQIKNGTFLELFSSNFCLYFSIYLIAVFLGFCLIGKPIIYIIPVFIGIGIGTRLAYYFINFSTKGVGYSLIMIVPYIALFMTAIAYTINTSNDLSTKLMKLTKGESKKNFEVFPYLKKYLIYSLIIVGVTILDSGLTKLLFSIVTI